MGTKGADMKNNTGKKVQLLDDIENADLNSFRNEYHFKTPIIASALSSLLLDKRDAPMVYLQLNIIQYLCIMVPMVYYVNLVEPPFGAFAKNAFGLVYLLGLVILFFERFILCLHFGAHRPIYKFEVLNHLCTFILAPFFGIPCGLYKVHHVVMHHIENNHDWDISSTEFYQRDSWFCFFKYWFRFTVLIAVELPLYAYKAKRWNHLKVVLGGLVCWGLCVFFLAKFVSMRATMWVFVIPHYLALTLMAFGNWSQHIFVDPSNPESNYALTYNCLDTPVNKTTFNDGYHVIHHANARLHWSEMPAKFYEMREKHALEGALTFRGVHFFDVGVLVMTGNLRKLAEHYVHIGAKDQAPTVDWVEGKMREWLKPMSPVQSSSSKRM